MTAVHNILIVDDEPESRLVMAECLRASGHSVCAATSAIEALETMELEPPEATIIDLLMPCLDGLWLIGEMRKRPELSKIPIIIVSALSPEEWPTPRRITARLQKPVDFVALQKLLQRLQFKVTVSV